MLWNDKFAIGITTVDEQHEQLFNLMESVHELTIDAKSGIDCYDEIETVLRELERYTIVHFEDEEALMEKVGYENIDTHREEHNAFVAKVHDTLDSDVDLHQVSVLEEVYEFLLQWVSDHILYTDVKYVPIMKEKL